MSTATTRRHQGEDGYWYSSEQDGYGWLIFAGTAMMIAATLNGIDGIAAISNSKFFAHGAYIIGDLNTWGWVLLAISVVQGLAGIGIWLGMGIARWTGVAIVCVNAVVQLLFIPAYPLWSMILFGVDMLILYGLVVHGDVEVE